MPDSMIFVEQVIKMVLKEEGSIDTSELIHKVALQMKLPELEPFIESTLGIMIGNKSVKVDGNGKVYI